ncbi:protein TANC2-like isoform X3 [Tigriopus californicus]|uniref:protein TANC2-like isoform X3 n=1 Tax=Tigriopus californicus TaxID=6832 RepID=UPI0027DA0975|nr:protein TANC2-like isoform X3 [Tigriopus californicus]
MASALQDLDSLSQDLDAALALSQALLSSLPDDAPASIPPPPPPLGLEKWQSIRKTDPVPPSPSKRSIFSRFNVTSPATIHRHDPSANSPERKESTSSNSSQEDSKLISKSSSSSSSTSDVTVIQANGLAKQKNSSKMGTLAKLKKKTGKSAEDIRKLFPNFYISPWSSSTPSTPTNLTSRSSVRMSKNPHPTFTQKIRQEFHLNRSMSADRSRGASEDEEECYRDLSAVRRLMSSESPSRSNGHHPIRGSGPQELCPSCQMPFDKGKKRRLVDTCGHQRCYSCMFKRQECPVCFGQGSSPAKLQKSGSGSRLLGANHPDFYPNSPSLSIASSNNRFGAGSSGGFGNSRSRTQSPSLHGPVPNRHQNGIQSNLTIHGDHSGGIGVNRRFVPSPKLFRSPWLQHQRRSHLLSDGKDVVNGNGKPSGSGAVSSLPLSPLDSRRSASGKGCNSIEPSSHSRESGFQSATSLTSLEKVGHEHSPVSTLDGLETGGNDGAMMMREGGPMGVPVGGSQLSADSMVSLISGLSDSASNPLGSRRHSLTTLKQQNGEDGGSRRSVVRRSARFSHQNRHQPTHSLISEELRSVTEDAPLPQLRQLYWTLKPLFFEVPSSEAVPIFTGRHWLYREIVDHITSDLPTNRGVVITGHPGTGKTSVILQLVEHSCFGREEGNVQDDPNRFDQISMIESIYGQSQLSTNLGQPHSQPKSMKLLASQIVAYHFCQSDNAPTCLVAEFIHSLAAQMSQAPQLTPYYQLVNSDPNLQNILSLPGCVSDPSGSFVQGIMEPLHALRRLGRLSSDTCLIVIDGLCDAEIHRPDHGHTLASFLSKHLEHFPDWLKIVCTVRTGMQDITKSLPFQRISLDKTDVDERLNKDMTDYISLRISRSASIQTNITPISAKLEGTPQERITLFLVQVAHGCFLYVKMVLELIERGHLVIKSSSFNVLPLSLSEIFLLEFNLKFSSLRSFEKVQDILATALASLVPLTPQDLYNSVNALHCSSSIQWGEFLMRFSSLATFLLRRADDTVMFFHPTFKDWLIKRREFDPKKFLVDPRMGHAAIAFRMCRGDTSLGPDKTLELGHHILKAHIYKDKREEVDIPPRDLQAMWVAMTTEDVSIALGAVRNVSSPNVKVSRLLLLAGASPDHISDYLTNAPLVSVFANQGYLDMVALLIEFGADINAINSNGMTALMFAAKQGHLDIVRLLFQHGAVINLIDKTEMSALVFAAKSGHLNTISFLVSCDWVTDSVNDLGLAEAAQQAMVISAEKGHEQVLEFLLDMAEVKINHSDTLTGNTALCAAASCGQRRCVEILLRRGAKVALSNLKESSPLHLAIGGGHWEVTELLLKEGANLEQADSLGRTPLMISALEGHTGLLELLISKHALIEAHDNDGLSALGWACLKARTQAVVSLLDQGADVNHADKTGRTPLDLAAYKGEPEVVQLLLDRGGVMEHVDIHGMRPLDRAISAGHKPVVECFLKKGAKLGPATWSLAANKQDILMILLNKLLEDGNTLYRKNRFDEAAHRYQYALRRLPTQSKADTLQTFDQLKIHLLLNLSRCKRKMGDFPDAIQKATDVILFRPNCLEAYQARARAYRENEEYEEAITDLTEALKISPQNREIHKFIIKVKEELKENQKEKNNNLNRPQYPIGMDQKDGIKFVDDSSSVTTNNE